MQPHNLSIFIFRRDHRLEDNTALLYALQQSLQVFPCFIFDSVQIDPSRNPYFGNNCVQFMIESLRDLDARLKEQDSRLFFFHGEIEPTITHILKTVKPDALYINEDVTPYARKRDKKIAEICQAHSVKFYAYEDIMILPKNVVRDKDGTTFKVFSPYHREAIKFTVRTPFKNNFENYYLGEAKVAGEYPLSEIGKFYKENPDIEVHGGRTNALQILDSIQSFKNYAITSNIPHIPTTKLSAYNKFGCVSIREVYWSVCNTLGKNCNLMKELFWRDFYYYLAYHDPSILEEGMKPEYHDIKYEDNMEYFEKWKNAETGCPIVDAGMRHLNKTGFMPNRLRMTVANFLIKDLLVSWKHGERYFAQMLVDYDPCQNNGGWQWCSSTGADSRDFLRIFNPALQSQKFDPDCKYILQWIPELAPVSKENIHNWETNYQLYSAKKLGYPNPIIKHAVQRKKCIEMYNNAKPVKEGNLHSSQSTQGEDGEETKENIKIEKNHLKRKAENGHEMTPNFKKNKTSASSTPAKGVQFAITTWFKKSPADKTNQTP